MYVGDDDAVDHAVTGGHDVRNAVIGAAVALVMRGAARVAGLGVAAYYGYRAYKARKKE